MHGSPQSGNEQWAAAGQLEMQCMMLLRRSAVLATALYLDQECAFPEVTVHAMPSVHYVLTFLQQQLTQMQHQAGAAAWAASAKGQSSAVARAMSLLPGGNQADCNFCKTGSFVSQRAWQIAWQLARMASSHWGASLSALSYPELQVPGSAEDGVSAAGAVAPAASCPPLATGTNCPVRIGWLLRFQMALWFEAAYCWLMHDNVPGQCDFAYLSNINTCKELNIIVRSLLSCLRMVVPGQM